MRLILLVIALAPGLLNAQRQCKKGIPCGNSCISASKVCRIGNTSSSRPADAVVVPPPPASSLALSGRGDSTIIANVGHTPFTLALRNYIPLPVNVSGTSFAWLRQSTLTDVLPDHIVLQSGDRRARIPLTSVSFVFTDDPEGRVLTIVLRP